MKFIFLHRCCFSCLVPCNEYAILSILKCSAISVICKFLIYVSLVVSFTFASAYFHYLSSEQNLSLSYFTWPPSKF